MKRDDRRADRLLPGLLLFWAGLSAGVAFLATPAKFMASSLSLPLALDVGRQTFSAYNATELVLVFLLLVMSPLAARRVRWYLALAIPAAAVLAQKIWLLPALDARVSAILAGMDVERSSLHATYIALEALKVVALGAFGLGMLGATRQRLRWL